MNQRPDSTRKERCTINLLIIEDDPNFGELVGRALEGLVERVNIVCNWHLAFQHVREQQDEVAWVDLRMPTSTETQSIENIELLRKHHTNVVIIVGSGYVTPEIRAKLERAGVDGVFYKSGHFNAEQIATLIILGLMKASKRNPHFNDRLLTRGLEWLRNRFPGANVEAA